MFKLLNEVLILVLMSVSNSKKNIIKNITGNFVLIPENYFLKNPEKYLLLKDQICKVRKIIIDNDYMACP